MSSGINVEVEGLDQALRALRGVDREAGKALNATMKQGAKQIAGQAGSLASSAPSGLAFASGGYKVKPGRKAGRKSRSSLYGWVVENLSSGSGSQIAARPGAAAAIIEFAGKASSGKTPQGAGLIAALDARSGQPGRYAWRAFDEQKGDLEGRMRFVMANIERKLQREV